MKLFGLPDDLRDALQVLMCERTYLVQIVKGLIEKLLPSLLEENRRHQLLLA
jgi:SpoU rRNA methylase family enzyme